MGRPATPIEHRFWAKVSVRCDQPQNCWLWIGAKDRDGYGFIKRKDGKQLRTHRLSYEIFQGPKPKNYFVCHHCDTPTCVNPNHLFAAPHIDNVKDKVSKGRSSRQHGADNPMSKLNLEQVKQIKNDVRNTVAIANDFSVSKGHIRDIKSGRRWAHVLRGQ